MAGKVRINVRPTRAAGSHPLNDTEILASPLDQTAAGLWTPLVFVFQLDPTLNRDVLTKALEVGLAHTLSHSRLAAGWVIRIRAGDIAIAVRDDDTIVLEIESLDEDVCPSCTTLENANFPQTAVCPKNNIILPEDNWGPGAFQGCQAACLARQRNLHPGRPRLHRYYASLVGLYRAKLPSGGTSGSGRLLCSGTGGCSTRGRIRAARAGGCRRG